MKRWIVAGLVALLSLLPVTFAAGEEKPAITLSKYSTYSTAATLGFTFKGSADQVRITVDPTVVPTRSALNEKNAINGLSDTFALSQDNVFNVTLITPALKVQGAHRAKAELLSSGKVVAATTFFISQLGGSGARRTPVVWIWPIAERPHRGLDNTFLDDQLATDIAAGGRLTQLVKAGAGAPVVWALDPELLASVEQMSLGYQVRRGGKLVDGVGANDAKVWLDALRAATNGREVIALPYSDPDLSSISPTQLEALRSYGEATIARVLNRSDLMSDIGWAADGDIGKSALQLRATITRAGTNDGAFTPSASGPLIGSMRALIGDTAISTALSRNDISGANRVIAELATITAERPADPRVQLLVPPRMWSPTSESLLSLLGATRSDAKPLTYLLSRPAIGTAPATGKALPRPYLETLKSMVKKVGQTQAVLGSAYEPSIDRYARAFTAVNANFRVQKSTLIALLDQSATSYVNTLRILPGRYTLTGKEQSIPITIVNGFDRPVRLSVDIEPHAPRVIVRNAGSIDIPANGRTQLQVPIESVATGRVAADGYLISSSGLRYGDGVVLNLDVRNIGPVGNWILYGPVALLALALTLRLTRFIRRRGKQ